MEWPDDTTPGCRDNYSYFTTSEYMRTVYHCTAMFQVPLSLFTYYVILRVTPKRMENMKIPLLIAHCCSVNLDLVFTVLTSPVLYFPSASGTAFGVLSALGVPVRIQAYYGQSSIVMVGVSVIILYENRHSQIASIRYKIGNQNLRICYYFANFFCSFLIVVPFYLDGSEQVELREFVLKKIPCPTIDFYTPNTIVLLKGGEPLPFYSITGSLLFVSFQLFFFLFHTIYHLFSVTNDHMSNLTKSLQKKFLGSVSIQITIPYIAIAFPITFSLYAYRNNLYNQAYNNNSMVVMMNHGTLHSICTLILYKPYRDFTREIIFKKKQEPEMENQTKFKGRSRGSMLGSISG